MSEARAEIVVRKVRVLAPMAGEIEVTIDLTEVINRLAIDAAKHAYRLRRGWSHGKVSVFAPAHAVCTSATIAAREAFLKLNNEKRDHVSITLETGPE